MQCTIVAAKVQAVGNQTYLMGVLNAATGHNPNGLTMPEPFSRFGAAWVCYC